MNHVLVLIAAHCEPEVLKYTLGTWLEHYDKSYRVTVCMTLHNDYSKYSDKESEILGMKPPIDVFRVPLVSDITSSRQHSFCLRQMLERHANGDFTHVAFLDHDLGFKADFIKWAIGQHSEMVGSVFGDRVEPRLLLYQNNHALYSAPQVSIWHLVLDWKLGRRIAASPSILEPHIVDDRLFYDTGALFYETVCCEWGIRPCIVSEKEIAQMVEHFWSLSLATYSWDYRIGYGDKIAAARERYANRFPNGIGHLLEKLK